MNIAIIGTGHIGQGLAGALARTRHGVVLGGRTPRQGQAAAESVNQATGALIQGADIATAVRSAAVVILAVPFDAVDAVLAAAGDLSGKIVVDPTNPLTADYMSLTVGFNTSAAEQIQARVGEVPVVKAFNTVFASIYAEGPRFGEMPVQVFYAGNQTRVKEVVAELIRDAGFEPVDAGPLTHARYLEPLAALNIQFGYALGRGTQIAPAWLARPPVAA